MPDVAAMESGTYILLFAKIDARIRLLIENASGGRHPASLG